MKLLVLLLCKTNLESENNLLKDDIKNKQKTMVIILIIKQRYSNRENSYIPRTSYLLIYKKNSNTVTMEVGNNTPWFLFESPPSFITYSPLDFNSSLTIFVK